MVENDHNGVCKGEENKKIRLMESKRNTLPTVQPARGGGETGFVVASYAYNN